jgi:ribosomal protein S15P/S13E
MQKTKSKKSKNDDLHTVRTEIEVKIAQFDEEYGHLSEHFIHHPNDLAYRKKLFDFEWNLEYNSLNE